MDTHAHVDEARPLWLRDAQSQLQQNSKCFLWKDQLDLSLNDSQVCRCEGRMECSDLSPAAQHLILLDKQHHVTALIIMDVHHWVMHNRVKETLTELRLTYWLVHGRLFVLKLIYSLVYHKLEGKPYQSVPLPALPEYRVRQSRSFQYTGVDFTSRALRTRMYGCS